MQPRSKLHTDPRCCQQSCSIDRRSYGGHVQADKKMLSNAVIGFLCSHVGSDIEDRDGFLDVARSTEYGEHMARYYVDLKQYCKR